MAKKKDQNQDKSTHANSNPELENDRVKWLEEAKPECYGFLRNQGFKESEIPDIYQHKIAQIVANGFHILYDKELGVETPDSKLKSHFKRHLKNRAIDLSRSRKRRREENLSEIQMQLTEDEKTISPERACSSAILWNKLLKKVSISLENQESAIFRSFQKAVSFNVDDLYLKMSPDDRKQFEPEVIPAGESKISVTKKNIGRKSGNVLLKILQLVLLPNVLSHLRKQVVRDLNWYETEVYDAMIRSNGRFEPTFLLKKMPASEVKKLEEFVSGCSPDIQKRVIKTVRNVRKRLLAKVGAIVFAEII